MSEKVGLVNLKSIRKAKGNITQEIAAQDLGVSLSTYRGWEQLQHTPHGSTVKLIAEYFGCSSDELFGIKEVSGSRDAYVYVPLRGCIAAGEPIEAFEITETFPVPREIIQKRPRAFCLMVCGESVNKIIADGSIAVVDPDSTDISDGKPYAVRLDNDSVTIKRVYKLNNGVRLVPDSTDPTFKELVVDKTAGVHSIEIIGQVIWDTKPFNFKY